MIKKLDEDTVLKLKSLDPEYKEKKGVLGRLYGQVASFAAPTRNGRKYSQDLWQKLFDSPLIKERFKNGGIFGQLCHPDYEEVDMEKIAVVMPEPPVKNDDGQLIAYVDILDTPCGRIAYQLAKYGYKFGISSRGTGDIIDGPDGEEVDPDTYQLNAFDLVEIPAVESARLAFTESLDTKKLYNKTLKQRLTEELDNASDEDKKLMTEALDNFNIKLTESGTRAWLLRQDGTTIPQVVHTKLRSNAIEDVINSDDIQKELKTYRDITNSDEAKDLIDRLFRAIDSGSDDTDSMQYLYNLIFADFNNEFVKVRVGGMYGDDGESEIYFRISSKDINWYDAICKFMMEHPNIADYITVGSDIEILHKEDYRKLNGKEIKHMPVEEFIMAKGNPVVESKNISDFEYNILSGKGVVESYGPSNYIGHISNRFDSIEDITENYNLNDIVSYSKNESISESCGDKEEVNDKDDAGNSGDELLVDELQEALLKNKELEEDNLSLQEKLSVCNAKGVKLEEDLARYKDAIVNLSKAAKQVKPLTEKLENLTSSLKVKENVIKANKNKLQRLIDESKEVNDKATSLEEQLNKAKVDVDELNEKLEIATNKYNTANLVIQKYKKELKESKDLYIQSKADMYNVSAKDVLSKLTESYNLKDVDSVCKKLSERNYNMRKLPFQINENVSFSVKESDNEYITRGSKNDDDYVDDSLLRLLNLK